MMELNDSTAEHHRNLRDAAVAAANAKLSPEPRPVPLAIDLNEIPSPPQAETLSADPDSVDVVRSFHYNLQPPPGPAAGVPGEGRTFVCGACGRPEVKGEIVVCDGCERGFHLNCAGMQESQQGNWEWVCLECSNTGVMSKRWPLGVKSKLILDINASPPSDGEGSEELPDFRKHTSGDNSFGSNPFGGPMTYSNFLYAGNGYGFQKASGIMTQGVTVAFHGIMHQTQVTGFEEVGYPFGKLGSNLGVMLPQQNPVEILQALRDFISERRGVLGDGWRVEFKQSIGSCGLYAVYCAPDGKTFDSMSEVACYLGLMSNCNSPSPAVGRSTSTQDRLHLPKRRKLTKFSNSNGSAENKGTIKVGYYKDPSSDGQIMGSCTSKLLNAVKAAEAGTQEKIVIESQQANDGVPLQFEDFYILSLGTVDMRPSYHDVSLIWPVGYRSCWHDKMTGSFFLCEVLDGGESGPVFKVRRRSCSTLLVPIGSTVLVQSSTIRCVEQTNEESDDMAFRSVDYDNDASIQTMLVDPSPPLENEVLSCLGGSFSEPCTDEMSSSVQFEGSSGHDGSGNLLLSQDSSVKDVIGEISVEEPSPALAWRSLSQKFIAACSEICKQADTLKFICKHANSEMCSPYSDTMDKNRKASFSSLAKFCSSQCSVRIPSVLHGDKELDSVFSDLEKWLNQDRFGLDAEFVQEIIEQLPGVSGCSQYKCLKERSTFPSSLTVGNGFLMVNRNGGYRSNKGCGLYEGDKKVKLAEDQLMDYPHSHPPGKPLGSRLPPQLVSDVYQVWELLRRFHEILGLNEPLSLEELEEELINPWSDRSNVVEKLKCGIQGNQTLNLHDVGGTIGQVVSTNSEFGTVASRGDPHEFIQMETGKMKETVQGRVTSFTYGRYSGKALTKAHNALLKVLIAELQSKVAALVDPTFDAGESKTKRGRKRDADSSFPSRRTKINMLPINELTWPELARRYILAVLSMDGILDSAEITARESVKVFRCLQGDGGLLCGSLTGVAGMEADALLLAEASKNFFGSPSKENVLTIDDEGSDASGACEKSAVNDVILPEWAEVLEPVRKLPTNVGTRIRKCVYEALEKGPPEWAKEILEHSISKEVYKGNASGPTKKAVLSVLANVCSEGLLQKPEKRKKKKTVISVSDIIMKQCRIVLRHAAAADDAKVFCNLLGRKPISSSDNDDEGFLGSPGMMSRPLDFRTIDLRLAVGAYGGSHEAFLEDVRELWSIVHAAYSDQPDLVELAETLSQNFESMYEKEVVTLVEKFVEYAKSDSLSVEMKKGITDIVASTNEIPKAPWEEGVCKVCGIDRDDDSVLLCDTCDAEYHTYCLNPPLARIPEGNWYCPSCAGKRMVKDASERSRIIFLHRGKKYQGEVTRVYLESLARLADVIEQKEYWEFTAEERTSLLKFLCDDLLCSSLLRQHLEQCVETSAELQQRLRSLSVEWRNLKSKEEILSARAAKDASTFNFAREACMKEGHVSPVTNHVKSVGQTKVLGDSSSYLTINSDDLAPLESNKEGSGHEGTDKTSTCRSQMVDAANTEDHSEDRHVIVDGDVQDNTVAHMHAETGDQSSTMNESASSKSLLSEKDDSCRPTQPTSEQGENCLQSGMMSNQVTMHVPPVMLNESQAYQLELNSVRSDILLLEDSITNVVSQLLKSSVRREFLGIDSNGRMYWASASLGGHPQVIVDGSSVIQHKRKRIGSVQWNSVLSGVDGYLNAEGSKAHCPYLHESNTAIPMGNCSPWGCYQSDTEIKELIRWLKDNDPKERELKDSILNWQKMRFSGSRQTSKQGLDHLTALSIPTYDEKTQFSSFVTKATTLLEKKYGPCHDAETNDVDVFKKRGKKAKGMNGEKIYRCECMELIWPSRYHCSFCHKTFSSNTELEGHSDCKSSSGSPAPEKSKDVNGSIIGKGVLISEIIQDECADEMGIIKASKGGLIKFTDNELACPYSFDEICSKFVTNNSNKELVQEIGLLGTNGVPSFLPSISPCIEDSPFLYDISGTQSKPIGKQGFPPENGNIATTGHDCITHTSILEKLKNNQQALGCSGQRKFSLEHHQRMGIGRCSVVPQSSLRPLNSKVSHISKWLKANLLDMDAALPEEALRPSKASSGRRCAWRAFVKSAETIYEMVQAIVVLENMIRAEYLRNEWWYWSSLTAAAKISTMSSLALRIYSLDAAIIYEKTMPGPDPNDSMKPSSTEEGKQPLHSPDPAEKTSRITRKSSKKRKEAE